MDPSQKPTDNQSDDPLTPGQQPATSAPLEEPDMTAPTPPVPGTSISPASTQPEADAPVAPSPTPDPTPAITSTPPAPTAQPVEAPASPTPVAPSTSQIEETPDLPPQPPVLNKRIFTPPPEELLKKPSHKKRNIIIALVILFIASGVGAYFGYFVPNKPENIWKSALVNTGKGYDEIIKHSENAAKISDWSQEAEFNIDGAIEADGTFTGETSGNTSKVNGDISAMGMKLGFDVRTIPSTTDVPDMYFKVAGLDGLGTLLAQDDPTVASALNGLNNQWYVIDHTLFEQLEGVSDNPAAEITGKDVTDLFKQFGVTSNKYVFTDDAENAAVVVKDQIGRETKNGRSVYHYTVDANEKQADKYVTALCNDLKGSKIGKLLSSSIGEDAIDCSTDSKAAAGDVQLKAEELTKKAGAESDLTVDAWVDTKTKLFHAIRFSDKKDKKTFVEISQNFTGGDEMPFKLEMRDEADGVTTDVKLEATVNTKTQEMSVRGTIASSDPSNDDNDVEGDISFTMKPSKSQPKVERPEGAKNIMELLNALGIGDLLTMDPASMLGGSQASAQDTDMENNVRMLQMYLETYYNDKGYYPTLAEANKAKWIDTRLAADPKETGYSYVPKSTSGGACSNANTATDCQTYQLSALLTDGTTFTRESINM